MRLAPPPGSAARVVRPRPALQILLRPHREGAATAPAPIIGLIRLAIPSADSAALTHAAMRGVATLVQPGRRYQGAGVMLLDLTPAARAQRDWITAGDDDRAAARLTVLDQVNARWGRGTLRLAREGFLQPWAMRQDRRSPAYTTRWDALPVVSADRRSVPADPIDALSFR